ncbi:beta-ketoacyl synthase N-terminal-like domain-containing protein [Fulvivirga ligni]|uniref:beta-ketoacyl synthase N-terminal-like domain-containing protein n=1 Tax=Fulvivirga ligni TaxID=2904246 RepID=UPI001F3FA112|nr:beta-ketoacyl synthase N-terminal-like domain-containing protein [Fulvivirga ligni]UII22952.1 hypothetical protein LVD16_06915 [Fulvivirga ligni]
MSIYSIADNITSPLGLTSAENFSACINGVSGIQQIDSKDFYPTPFLGCLINREEAEELKANDAFSNLEQLFIHSINKALQDVDGLDLSRTALVVSTTKGNIDILADNYSGSLPKERALLSRLGNTLSDYFNLEHNGVVVSNACISGLSAIITAKKIIEAGLYDHAIVTGGDILSEFTISGFQCLKAMSDEPCQPYDADRKGITLGEACGTVILSTNKELSLKPENVMKVSGGGQANDANHISGPSRTGEGLKLAVRRALTEAQLSVNDIDYISAHGTATMFNDEMEAIAFDTLGLANVPLNSLKGFFGHTLGAAGIIESVMTMEQMRNKALIQSRNFSKMGVSKSLNIIEENTSDHTIKYALKTTSGFGGCNAALIFENNAN